MNKWLIVGGMAVTVFAAMAYGFAQETPKPEKGVLVGDAIEITTYAMKGHGEEHVAGAKSRAEHGFPVGILEEETGEIWVLAYRNTAPASHLETANKVMAPYIGQKVVVQGLKYRAKGVNVIRVSVVSEY